MKAPPCYDSVLDAVGHTPMVRLHRITAGLPCEVFAKLEFLNPMGSSKDRIARHMIEKAESEGRIRAGDLIIENSSGNTALALAMVAIQKGYRVKAVVRDRISKEKFDQLKAMGVDVHKADSSLPPEHPDSYNQITPRLARELPDCYFPDQHNNRENNEAHYQTTGPEIWEQMEGRIDYLVAGMGTGGTIGGVGRFLKERDSGVRVIAVDIEGSVYFDYFRTGELTRPSPYLLEGLGDEFIIGCADFSVLDGMVRVTDRDAFRFARELARLEGMLVGGSSGAAIWAVRRLGRALSFADGDVCGREEGPGDLFVAGPPIRPLGRPARVVTIFPDSASRYLSTIFNDEWMRETGMLD